MTQYSSDVALTELTAFMARVVGGSLHLGKGSPTITADTLAADLAAMECDFDGYAAIDPIPAALANYHDGLNTWSAQIATQQFNYVDAGTHVSNDVTFAWIEDVAGVLLQAFTLPGPVTLATNLDSLPIDLKFSRSAKPILP